MRKKVHLEPLIHGELYPSFHLEMGFKNELTKFSTQAKLFFMKLPLLIKLGYKNILFSHSSKNYG
jgi:hypothetical protein